ncbi:MULTISPECIES: alpha/beta hydrolase [unclassified Nocardioides]|uniref:alpha/beta hydrolase n=1 Tax=unclassified Nocardioides TaxID=2615069 RepID=UPI0006F78CD3|nr:MULTISPECIES: alpha/beta hydrolase [unclassified Nocardioides]KRA38632.1 hypothetical protein ASD81_08485 [Nocardioides sp. Root614]KRA92592.1 hypothetical protein ASD84_08750 [Nocardioides sp. Root682]
MGGSGTAVERRQGEVAEELRWILEAMVDTTLFDPSVPTAEARAAADEMWRSAAPMIQAAAPEGGDVVDHRIPVAGAEIPARLYRPAAQVSDGCHVYFHGGAYWLGSIDQDDNRCRWLAASSGVPVLSVGYRLAPEQPCPTPVEDCIASVQWVRDHAEVLGINPDKVSVGGESAGGHAAAMTALYYADLAESDAAPGLLAQVLNIPLVDFTDPVIYATDHDSRCTPSGKDSVVMRDLFFGDGPDEEALVAMSPARLRVDHLPPTYLISAQFDLFRDQDLAHAARLAAAGVEVSTHHAPDLFHGAAGLTALSDSSRRCELVHATFVRRAHADGGFRPA